MDLKFTVISRLSGSLDRKTYLLWGLLLFSIKYNLDRLVADFFDKRWFITDYYAQADKLSVSELTADEKGFYLAMLLTSIPFIWVGTVLTVKRLRNAQLRPWLVVFFFIPFLNLLLFLILATVPQHNSVETKRSTFLDRFIPSSRYGSAAFAVGLVSVFSLLLTLLFINLLGEYGWSLFVGIPFLLGFVSVFIYSYHNPVNYPQSVKLSLAAVSCFSLLLFVLALEGIICLLMGFPILFILAWIGSSIAFAIQEKKGPSLRVVVLPVLFIPVLGLVEHLEQQEPALIAVKTTVVVAANPQQVWNKLVAFSTIKEPVELIFQSGLAYPTHAEIEGTGVGAVRRCNFTTGTFVEPITTWEEPYLLAFSVLDQPPPMAEWSFYKELEITHLDGYFKSEKGQFKLTSFEGNKTLLEGTTWYRHDISPSFYWRWWSDFILHKIHLRVLNHIKAEAEKVHLSENINP